MGLSDAEQLGSFIANIANEQESMKEDMIPDESDASLIISPFENLRVVDSCVGTKKVYPLTSFILDHPVYGELDSSTLLLDGGYTQDVSNGCVYYSPLDSSSSLPTVDDDSTGGTTSSGTWVIKAGAYYPFNGNADDESTNSFDGTPNGTAVLTTDHLGNVDNAYTNTDNTGDISVPTLGLLNQDITMYAWVKLGDDNSGYIFADRDSTNGGVSMFVDSGEVRFIARGIGATNSDTAIPQDSAFHFVAFTYKESTRLVSYYLDGVPLNTPTLGAVTMTTPTGASFFERDGGNGSTTFLLGATISEFGIMEATLSDGEITHLYNITKVHKLDKPLVTKTDSNGDSITGYEFTGQASNVSGSGLNWGTYADIPAIGVAGDTTVSYYGKFMLSDDLSVGGTSDFIFGGRYGDKNTLSVGPTSNFTWRQDDSSLAHDSILNRGQIYQYIATYNYDSGTPADSVWNIYIVDADGSVIGSTKSRTGYDAFTDYALFLGAETRFGYIMRGVIAKPTVFTRLLSSDDRTALFAGEYIEEQVFNYVYGE